MQRRPGEPYFPQFFTSRRRCTPAARRRQCRPATALDSLSYLYGRSGLPASRALSSIRRHEPAVATTTAGYPFLASCVVRGQAQLALAGDSPSFPFYFAVAGGGDDKRQGASSFGRPTKPHRGGDGSGKGSSPVRSARCRRRRRPALCFDERYSEVTMNFSFRSQCKKFSSSPNNQVR